MSFYQKNMSLCKKKYVSMSKTTIYVFMSKKPYPPLLQSFLKKIAKKFGGIK